MEAEQEMLSLSPNNSDNDEEVTQQLTPEQTALVRDLVATVIAKGFKNDLPVHKLMTVATSFHDGKLKQLYFTLIFLWCHIFR
jgi:hypothetical protein